MYQQFDGIPFHAWLGIETPQRCDEGFLAYLNQAYPEVYRQLQRFRSVDWGGSEPEHSAWLMTLATCLEEFLTDFFDIAADVAILSGRISEFDDVLMMRKEVIWPERHRQAVSGGDGTFLALTAQLDALTQFKQAHDPERCLAHYVRSWVSDVDQVESLSLVKEWARVAWGSCAGQAWVASWLSFRRPEKLCFDHLVPVVSQGSAHVLSVESNQLRPRDGFGLTDSGMGQRSVAAEIDYCVFCHKSEGDFCRRSFPVKKKAPHLGVRSNPLGELLEGCPLDQRISESHLLRKQGKAIAALAMIMLDNPLCVLTGHRICNECMKSCIYQKQTPVNVPEIESRILKDVLSLPWGMEIYFLLMRWNPLSQKHYCQKPDNGYRVLVMGMGPAGLAMSHYLSYHGCSVVAIDGASLEPLPDHITGQAIKHYEQFKNDLSCYQGLGFGGVADYGITARWDKDLLKLLYLMFSRNAMFQCFGGIRFGGTMVVEDIWSLGFDHGVLALGAGLPKSLLLPNVTVPGVFQANDFLMNLHLNRAGDLASLNEFDYALPAVVVGGGLTAIDTATEVQAYYVRMVERIYHRYQSVVQKHSEIFVKEGLSDAEFKALQCFVAHGKEVARVRREALMLEKPVDFSAYIKSWGGVTIVYRRRMTDSPAYQRNHNEITKAMEEGVMYLECLSPIEVVVDDAQQMVALRCRKEDNQDASSNIDVPARSVFLATGAKPNIAYAYEHAGVFDYKDGAYQSYALNSNALENREIQLEKALDGVFTNYKKNNRLISLIGDVHAYYQGNVVKAIASAKNHYQDILVAMGILNRSADLTKINQWRQSISECMLPKVVELEVINDAWLKIKICMPLAASKHLPGHIYRLKPLNLMSSNNEVVAAGSESIVVQGLGDPKDKARLEFVLPLDKKSRLFLGKLRVGDVLSVLGPGGVRAKIHEGGTHICVGSINAAIYSLALAPYLKEKHADMVFLYDGQDAYPQFLFEAQVKAGVQVVQSNERAIGVDLSDCFFKKHHSARPIKQVVLLSQSALSLKIKRYLEAEVFPMFDEEIDLRAGVFGPMQCMLKGICAQCLQWQIDPMTQEKTKAVYACSWQIQPASLVDFEHLSHRQARSQLQRKLNAWWL